MASQAKDRVLPPAISFSPAHRLDTTLEAKMQSAISERSRAPHRRGLLVEPTYGYGDLVPRKPALREVFVEWFDAINFLKDRTRLLPAICLAYHVATFGILIQFFARCHSLAQISALFRTKSPVLGRTSFHQRRG